MLQISTSWPAWLKWPICREAVAILLFPLEGELVSPSPGSGLVCDLRSTELSISHDTCVVNPALKKSSVFLLLFLEL